MTAPRSATGRGLPAHVVLDSEGMSQLESPRPSRALLVALGAAAQTSGRVEVPVSVLVELRFDATRPRAAAANHRLRAARLDPLSAERARSAVRLLVASGADTSVVDAHVAATALHLVRGLPGTATIATSDPGDLHALLGGEPDSTTKRRATVLPL